MSADLSYDELTSAIDRAYASPPEEPLPLEALFFELRAAARPRPPSPVQKESVRAEPNAGNPV